MALKDEECGEAAQRQARKDRQPHDVVGHEMRVFHRAYPHKRVYVPHHPCTRECLGTYSKGYRFVYKERNPLTSPCMFGFDRQIQTVAHIYPQPPSAPDAKRFGASSNTHQTFHIVYRTPCNRSLSNLSQVQEYLLATESSLTIDLFTFDVKLHMTRNFRFDEWHVKAIDLSDSKESIPISCVNDKDDHLPGYIEYSRLRIPDKDVPLNISTDFLVHCECTDGCSSNACACRKLTFEESIRLDMHPKGHAGYKHRLLQEKVHSAIYECNKKCKCRFTCNNRVVQQPLSNRLQVFKTSHCGWGLRCLHDIPKGAFICVYAGRLLTDTKRDQEGKDEGDEYFAELDFIDVVERYKEGYESDVVDPDAGPDEGDDDKGSNSGSTSSQASSLDDFLLPGKKRKIKNNSKKDKGKGKDKEKAKVQKSQLSALSLSSSYSLRTLFGDDNVYLTDAREVGNIGRYLNHSCEPNVFVQNVFVDTHDPRFPWVAFFANQFIAAGEELRWFYGYQIGSVPGKKLPCYCFTRSCSGRLL